MNDFTKDELQYLLSAYWTSDSTFPGLLDKLKSMIENYDAKTIKVWHCEKCGHIQ
jgi:hypothetical protein